MKQNKNRTIITVVLIAILIFIRIFFSGVEQIIYYVYTINLAGLLIVLIPLLIDAYREISLGITDDSFNRIIAQENKRIRKKFVLGVVVIVITSFGTGIMIYLLNGDKVLEVLNDVLALLTLALSLEDESVFDWLVKNNT